MKYPLSAVKLSKIRIVLWVLMLVATLFAAWGWFRPYQWNADPAANGKIVGALVSQDQSHYWLTLHVKMEPGKAHDFRKPVRLLSGTAKAIEPADTTLAGDVDQHVSEIWFKFWLTQEEMAAPLSLQINDGRLLVKKSSSARELEMGEKKYHTSASW